MSKNIDTARNLHWLNCLQLELREHYHNCIMLISFCLSLLSSSDVAFLSILLSTLRFKLLSILLSIFLSVHLSFNLHLSIPFLGPPSSFPSRLRLCPNWYHKCFYSRFASRTQALRSKNSALSSWAKRSFCHSLSKISSSQQSAIMKAPFVCVSNSKYLHFLSPRSVCRTFKSFHNDNKVATLWKLKCESFNN